MPKQKILIVEDDESMREVISAALQDMDCTLFEAANGIQAVEIARREMPDLMLLDLMLPGMTGYQVCSKIREHPDTAAVPVIMVTGQNIDEAATKGLEVGAEDVLSKPFNISELKLRVKTILQLNRTRLMAGERARFQWVVDNAYAGYLFINRENVCTYINPKAREYLGIKSYHYPKNCKKFLSFTTGQFKRVSDAAWDAWPNLGDQAFLVRAESDGQEPLWLKVDTIPGDSDDQTIIRLDDVTENMLTFQNMCHFEHLVTHKLQGPLKNLLASLDTLEIRREDFSDEIIKLVDEARESAERLNKSIKGVMEHISTKREETGNETTTAGKLDNFAQQLAQTYDIKKLNVEIDPAVHMRELKVSSEELLQIFQELFDNSIKYHPDKNPEILIRVYPKDANKVTIEVSDDGISVPTDKLAKIGTPFYRSGKDTKAGSMGLGLSMIASMLTTRDGAFHVSNSPDGSGFVVSLELPTV